MKITGTPTTRREIARRETTKKIEFSLSFDAEGRCTLTLPKDSITSLKDLVGRAAADCEIRFDIPEREEPKPSYGGTPNLICICPMGPEKPCQVVADATKVSGRPPKKTRAPSRDG
jgi:hypothetical protein